MGVWGVGLYSGDFAADLRSTIAVVARLPFDPNRIVDILCETEPSAAIDASNEQHTTFWLIVADQFVRRGIVCGKGPREEDYRYRATPVRLIGGDSPISLRRKGRYVRRNTSRLLPALHDDFKDSRYRKSSVRACVTYVRLWAFAKVERTGKLRQRDPKIALKLSLAVLGNKRELRLRRSPAAPRPQHAAGLGAESFGRRATAIRCSVW